MNASLDLTPDSQAAELSPRLLQVIRFAADGLTDKEIAKQLGVTTATVDFHWRRLRSMYSQGTRTGIVVHVLRTQHSINLGLLI